MNAMPRSRATRLRGILWVTLMTWAALAAGSASPADAEQGIAAQLRGAVIRFVRERAPHAVSSIEVPPLHDFELPGVDDVEIRLTVSPRQKFTGNVPISAVLLSDGIELKRGIVTARVLSLVRAVVTTRSLPRGALIRRDDVALESREQHSLPSGVLDDPRLAVGRNASRSLPAGSVLRAIHIETLPIVARGQIVRLIFDSAGLRIEGHGKAREEGRAGDTIRVQNTVSRRDVSGRVDGLGVVHVE